MTEEEKKAQEEATAVKLKQEAEEKEKAGKTFTQEDLDRVVQKEKADAKAQAEKKIAEEVAKAIQKEREDAKKTEEERERDRIKALAEQNAEKERNLAIRENTADAKEKFVELKLPTKLVDFVVDEDKTKMGEKINSFKSSWDEALEEAVSKRMEGKAPVYPKTPVKPAEGFKEPITAF